MRIEQRTEATAPDLEALIKALHQCELLVVLTQRDVADLCGLSPYRVNRRVMASRKIDRWTDDLPEPRNDWRECAPEWTLHATLRWLSLRPLKRDV